MHMVGGYRNCIQLYNPLALLLLLSGSNDLIHHSGHNIHSDAMINRPVPSLTTAVWSAAARMGSV